MALNPNTKPTTPGTFNGEIRNGWSWVSAANMWLDFSGINIGNTNVVDNLANAGTTTLGLGSPIGLGNFGIDLNNITETIKRENPNFNINVNAGFGNGPEFRNLNNNQLNTLLTDVQPAAVVSALSNKLVTVSVIKSPNRGDVYFNGQLDTRGIYPLEMKAIPIGGYRFELREGNKLHPDIYIVKNNNNVVTLQKNGQIVETLSIDNNKPSVLSIQWDTSLWEINTTQAQEAPKYKINVFLDSSEISSLLKYSFGNQSGDLPDGILESTETGTFNIKPQSAQIGRDWNFNYVLAKNGVTINESNSNLQTYQLLPDVNYSLQVLASKGEIVNTISSNVGNSTTSTSTNVSIQFDKPTISTSTNVLSFNLASKKTSLSYSTSNATRVVYTLGNTTRELPANGTLSLTS